jgi:hypothetical protein
MDWAGWFTFLAVALVLFRLERIHRTLGGIHQTPYNIHTLLHKNGIRDGFIFRTGAFEKYIRGFPLTPYLNGCWRAERTSPEERGAYLVPPSTHDASAGRVGRGGFRHSGSVLPQAMRVPACDGMVTLRRRFIGAPGQQYDTTSRASPSHCGETGAPGPPSLEAP